MKQLDWNTHIPDEREGIDSNKLIELCEEPWFKVKSSFAYQHPSVVLLEEVILRNDVDFKDNTSIRQTLQMEEKEVETTGQRRRINGKGVSAINQWQTVDGKGTTAIKHGIKMDRSGASVINQGSKMDGKGDSAIKHDMKMVENGASAIKPGVSRNTKANNTTTAARKGINQSIKVDGKGVLPPIAQSSGVVRRMELDAGKIYVIIIMMYIDHAPINALSAHMIHIN